MKILNWNILSGGGDRIDNIIDSINSHSPDIVILTEFKQNKNYSRISSEFKKIGLEFQTSPQDIVPKTNSVFFASKIPFEFILAKQTANCLKDRMIAVKIQDCIFVGVFCNTGKTAQELFSFMRTMYSQNIDQKILLAGDLYYGPRGSSLKQYNKLKPLIESGLIDVWRYIHGNKIEWSCRSGAGKSQPDHFFCANRITPLIKSIKYSQEELSSNFSDHAPMILELNNDLGR